MARYIVVEGPREYVDSSNTVPSTYLVVDTTSNFAIDCGALIGRATKVQTALEAYDGGI